MSTNRDLVVRALRSSGRVWETVSETVGLPKPTLAGLLGSNPYGIDVSKLIRLRERLSSEEGGRGGTGGVGGSYLMGATLADLVAAVISDDPEVRRRYAEWIANARDAVAALGSSTTQGKKDADLAVREAAATRKALGATRKVTERRRGEPLSSELQACTTAIREAAHRATSIRQASAASSKSKNKNAPTADGTTVSDLLSELLGRLGVTDHVAFLAALVNHANEARSVVSASSSEATPTLAAMASQATTAPSLMSLMAAGLRLVRGGGTAGGASRKMANDACSTEMGVIVCDDAPDGDGGASDGPSFGRRYVIRAEPMTLERGAGFKVDAYEVLEEALALVETALASLIKDRQGCRTYALASLDALADAFAAFAASSGVKTVQLTTGGGGGKAYCAPHHEAKLAKLGLLVLNEHRQIQMHGGAGSKSSRNSRNSEPQHVHVHHHDDPYMKGCFGCFVGIAACECCMECAEYLDM